MNNGGGAEQVPCCDWSLRNSHVRITGSVGLLGSKYLSRKAAPKCLGRRAVDSRGSGPGASTAAHGPLNPAGHPFCLGHSLLIWDRREVGEPVLGSVWGRICTQWPVQKTTPTCLPPAALGARVPVFTAQWPYLCPTELRQERRPWRLPAIAQAEDCSAS